MKNKYKSREIESEGREPIFSPKKTDGTRDLLYFNPNDPTHKDGGVNVTIVKKSKYNKMKHGTKNIVVPEESAIVTAQGGKNKEALDAYKKRDYKKLDKVINQMPEDKVSKNKKYDGSGSLYNIPNSKSKKRLGGFKYNPNDTPNPNMNEDLPELNTPVETSNTSFEGIQASNTTGAIKPTNGGMFNKDGLNTSLNSLLTNAPALYNTGKGLFGKAQKTERNFFTPENIQYRDGSDPYRRAAQEEYQATKGELRRGSPNASTYVANAQMAANQRYKRTSDIENTELQRKTDVRNQNTQINNQARLTNLGLKNQYNDQDLQNIAKKDDYLGKGLEQFSSLAQMNTLNKNRGKSDEAMLKLLGSRNFKYNKNSGDIETKNKGSKNLKYKKKK